jgi:hypothetical protein
VAAYLDIGLIDSPRAASGPTKAVPTFDKFWGISPDPSQDGRMGQIESALGHHFNQMGLGYLHQSQPDRLQINISAPPVR